MNDGGITGERTMNDGGESTRLGRREFLVGAAATAAVVGVAATSCSSDDASSLASTTTPVSAPAPKHTPNVASNPFSLGVASGDPDESSVVLWTRLAPEPLAADGAGGMPDGPADVIWEVAEDPTFRSILNSGVFTTQPRHAHAAHVIVEDLEPGSTVHYRFRYGNWTSAVGRTAAMPTGSPDRYRIAVANCQMFEAGYYAAYRHLVTEDPDLVVHLGDYIYEYPFTMLEGRTPQPATFLKELSDYRIRYACYKEDEDLQAAHAAAPFVTTWDDHEVANNYMGDQLLGVSEVDAARQQKANAYQAWWEHTATRVKAPTDARLDIFQSVAAGDLFRLHLLDQRQYADTPPCRSEEPNLTESDYGDCDARVGEDRTRLGQDQDRWLADRLAEGGVTWNILGNPVVLAGVNAGTEDDRYYLDTWDGFAQARERLIAELAKVDNPVVLTGDYHAGMTLEVRATPFDQSSQLVAPEFMSPPISSVLFPADVSARTPQLLEQINAHGYLVVDVTPAEMTVAFRCLDDVTNKDSDIETRSTWKVRAGEPTPTKV